MSSGRGWIRTTVGISQRVYRRIRPELPPFLLRGSAVFPCERCTYNVPFHRLRGYPRNATECTAVGDGCKHAFRGKERLPSESIGRGTRADLPPPGRTRHQHQITPESLRSRSAAPPVARLDPGRLRSRPNAPRTVGVNVARLRAVAATESAAPSFAVWVVFRVFIIAIQRRPDPPERHQPPKDISKQNYETFHRRCRLTKSSNQSPWRGDSDRSRLASSEQTNSTSRGLSGVWSSLAISSSASRSCCSWSVIQYLPPTRRKLRVSPPPKILSFPPSANC